MPERCVARKLAFAEVFTRKQVGAIEKLRGRDSFAPFQFDGMEAQIGCAAAKNEQFAALSQQRAGDSARNGVRASIAQAIRRRFAPNVAVLAAESAVSAGPGGEATNPMEDFLGGARPVNEAVLFLEQGG